MAKFCSKCGNALPAENAQCQFCTTAQQSTIETQSNTRPISQMTIGEIGQTLTRSVTSANSDPKSEDAATVSVLGNKIKASAVIKIIAVILCLFFILPLYTIDFAGEMIVNFNGFNAVFGKTITYYRDYSERLNVNNFMAIFLLLVPVALLGSFQFKEKLSFVRGKQFKISIILSGVGLLCMVIFTIANNSKISDMWGGYVIAKYSFWYYASIILYILCGIISLSCNASVKDHSSANVPTTNPPQAGGAPTNIPPQQQQPQINYSPTMTQSSVKPSFCNNCGTQYVAGEDTFCINCGQNLLQ